MKTFLQKHRIALIAVAGVLCFGILTGLVISGAIRISMSEHAFTTVADAKKQTAADPWDDVPEKGPEPTPTPEPSVSLSAEEVSQIARQVEMRRRTIIPVRTDAWVAQNTMLWNEETPTQDQIDLARQAAKEYTQMLFEKTFEELTGYTPENATVQCFKDKDGDRGEIVRVTDPEGNYILTVNASDWKLICADLLTYPDTITANKERDVLKLAEKLGYNAKPFSKDSNERAAKESVYLLTTDTDECLALSYCGGKLWQVAIYPNQSAMEGNEYFLADIQMEFDDLAYPEKFVKAEPPETSEEAHVITDRKIFASLTRLYRNLSGEELDASKLIAEFYRDESGAREDCWKVTGGGFEIVISAYSGNIISFTGSIPCKDLAGIPYDQMGGAEYEIATKLIAENMVLSLGSFVGLTDERSAKEISVNAVYDGNYCTMDIVCNDGTWYECYYEGGVLKEIWYYADEHMFMDMPQGWVANGVYIHPYTGKPFIPEYRDWDGDLHVKARPEK